MAKQTEEQIQKGDEVISLQINWTATVRKPDGTMYPITEPGVNLNFQDIVGLTRLLHEKAYLENVGAEILDNVKTVNLSGSEQVDRLIGKTK